MYFLYLIYLFFQVAVYTVVAPFARISKNTKFKTFVAERAPAYFKQQLSAIPQLKNQRVYWLHVSSAGELEQAIPVLRYLFEQHNVRFFVTYFSPSAKPFIKNVPGLLAATSLPIDKISNHLKIIKHANISQLLFVRYDIWPGILLACRQKGIPINLLAATKNRAKKSLLSFFGVDTRRYFFRFFNSIFAVSENDAAYYKSFSTQSKVFFAGDPKWMRAKERVEALNKAGLRSRLGTFVDFCFAQKNQLERACFVFGSPHAEEHDIALRCAALPNKCLILYAPGEMNETTIEHVIDDFKKIDAASVVRLSALTKKLEAEDASQNERSRTSFQRSNESELPHLSPAARIQFSADSLAKTVIIIDQMGVLAEIYALADVAIVGGGFDGQIHNTLEPAAHPVAVAFGNKLQRALEARRLVDAKAAKSFDSTMKLFEFLSQCSSLRKAGATDLSFVQELANMRLRALELFGEMPNTNKIIAESLI